MSIKNFVTSQFADIASYNPSTGEVNGVTVTGNVVAGYFYGDGSNISNLNLANATGGYSNANVANYLPTYTGNISAGNIYVADVLEVTDDIISTGNVSAVAFIGNGSQLSNINIANIAGSYSNSNVASYLPTYTGNVGANVVTANLFNGDGGGLSNVPIAYAIENGSSNIVIPVANANIIGTVGGVTTLDLSENNVAIGANTRQTAPGDYGVAIGWTAGSNTQANYGVAIGYEAGAIAQGEAGVAVGTDAGYLNQGLSAIAIGTTAGYENQSTYSIAMGDSAGMYNMGEFSIAIGKSAGYSNLGNNSIAIGHNAGGDQADNSIVISASGNALQAQVSGLFIDPVRNDNSNTSNVIFYNVDTMELTYAAMPPSYTNANVAAYLPVYGGNISANVVTATLFSGNGSQISNINISNIAGSYSNSNVAAYLPTNTSSINANAVTATFFQGDGGGLSNILYTSVVGAYSNANVGAYLPAYSGNILANHVFSYDLHSTNAVTSNTILANGFVYATNVLALGNVTSNVVVANVSVTAPTITANYFYGDGSNISNINAGSLVGGYGNANVAAYLPTYGGNLAANVVTANIVNIDGDATVGGNLTVTGNIDYTNVQDLVVGDPLIFTGANNTSDIVDLGLVVQYDDGNTQYGGVVRNHNTGYWTIFEDLPNVPTTTVNFANATLATVLAGAFIGDGNQLSNINIANIAGSYANSNVAAYLPTYSGLVTAGNANVTGAVTAAYFVGDAGNLSNVPVASIIANSTSNLVILSTGNVTGSIAGNTYLNFGNTSKAVALGIQAGSSAQSLRAVAVGYQAGQTSQTGDAVAVGSYAGQTSQGSYAVAVGSAAGNASQGSSAVAVGTGAGQTSQGAYAVAIGAYAGNSTQSANSIAIGSYAQASNSAIVLNATGATLTGQNAGLYAAPVRNDNSNTSNVIFYNVSTQELTYAAMPPSYANANVAAYLPIYGGNIAADVVTANIFNGDGYQLSNLNLANATGGYGNSNVADYLSSGTVTTDIITTANVTGILNDVSDYVTLGNNAGGASSTDVGVAIGPYAGYLTQGANAIAVGWQAGGFQMGAQSIAIGYNAGYGNVFQNLLGANSIAIGAQAAQNGAPAGTIILNASGVDLSSTVAGFFVNPVRNVPANIANAVYFNSVTKEISYAAAYANTNVAAYLPTYGGNLAANVVTANLFSGNGSQISNINVSNIAGSYANSNVAAYLPTYTGNLAGNNITITNESNFGAVGNITITGGSAGQFISTDGAGNLSFANAITKVPAVYFTANTSGNNLTFANTVLSAYAANTDITLFYNGSLLDSSYYSLSGDTITVKTPLTTGDNIDIIQQFSGTFNNVVTNGYGNANVAAYMPTYTGNVGAGYINASDELTVATNNGHGGVGYAGIMTMTNTSSNVTNANKFIRLNNTGALEIVNSLYSNVILALSDSGNATIIGLLSSPLKTVTSSSPGTVGQICWDANYIYVCVADNTWKRSALTGGF